MSVMEWLWQTMNKHLATHFSFLAKVEKIWPGDFSHFSYRYFVALNWFLRWLIPSSSVAEVVIPFFWNTKDLPTGVSGGVSRLLWPFIRMSASILWKMAEKADVCAVNDLTNPPCGFWSYQWVMNLKIVAIN